MPVMMPAAGTSLAIHAMSRELRQLEKRRAGIEQRAHALARQQLAAREVPLTRRVAAAFADLGNARREVVDHAAHGERIGAKRLRTGIERGLDHGHGGVLPAARQRGGPSCGSHHAKAAPARQVKKAVG